MILKPDQEAAEMLFLNSKSTIADYNKPYIRVYDDNFNVMDTLIMPLHITGLTSIGNGCDWNTVYAAHSGYPTADYLNLGPDTTLHISYYDLEKF